MAEAGSLSCLRGLGLVRVSQVPAVQRLHFLSCFNIVLFKKEA